METYKLYGGQVTLTFNEARHLYTVDDKAVDGVTTVLSIINKPALLPWAAKMASEEVARCLKPGVGLDELEIIELCDRAKKAYRAKAERAATIGSAVHAWIEDWINKKNPPMPTNPEMRNGVDAFLRWVSSHNVQFLNAEEKIFSRKNYYAGTFDFEALIDGELYLGDIKTSSGIYDEMFFQTAAYQAARMEEFHDKKYVGNIIVNCRKDGTLESKVSTEFEANHNAFLAALTLYRRTKELKYRKEWQATLL